MKNRLNIAKKLLSFILILSMLLSSMAVLAEDGDGGGDGDGGTEGSESSGSGSDSDGGGDENAEPLSYYFKDANLSAAVKDKLGKDTASETELENIQTLNADDRGIESLEGIQYLSGLVSLSLNRNKISDISITDSLTGLTSLKADDQSIPSFALLMILDREYAYVANKIIGFGGETNVIKENDDITYDSVNNRVEFVKFSAAKGTITWNFLSAADGKSFSGTVAQDYQYNWYHSIPVLNEPVLTASDELTLSWSEISGASEYKIFRRSDSEDAFTELDTTAGISYTDNNSLDPDAVYFYKIQSGTKTGLDGSQVYWSEDSNIVSASLSAFVPLSISLNKTSAVLKMGGSDTLKATVTGTLKDSINDITIESSAPAIVSVDKNGTVKGLKSGSAKITVTVSTKNGREEVSASADITVSAVSVSVNHENPSILKGNSIKLVPNLQNTAYSVKTTSFKTSDAKVASVSSAGVVKGIKAGTATITITVKDSNGNSYTKAIKAAVKGSADKNTSYTASTSAVTIIKGNKYQPKPTLKNSKSTISKTTYTTSNKKIVSVTSAGIVTGVKAGTAVITMTSATKDSQTLVTQVKIAVKDKAANAAPTLTASGKLTVLKGNSTTITPKLKNSKSSIQSSTFKTSNKKIATVTGKGVVKGKKTGTATITITSKTKDNHTLVTKVKIRVSSKKTKATSYINVSSSKSSAAVGKTLQIKRSLKNSGSKISTTAYKSSNTKVAVVDAKGKVTGVKKGTATITVTSTTKNKEILTAKIKVKITYAPNEAAIEKELLKLINADRKTKKKTALTSHSSLNGASKQRSKELKKKLNYNKRPNGTDWKTILNEKKYSYEYTSIGGNAGWNSYASLQKKYGTSISDKKIAQQIYSSLNKTTMRSSNFTDAGIGVYYSGGKIYYTIILGAK